MTDKNEISATYQFPSSVLPERVLSGRMLWEPNDAEKAADLAVWAEGHDARLKGKYVNPYDPFKQRQQFAGWLSGFQAAQLSLKMDEELRPVADKELEEIYMQSQGQTLRAQDRNRVLTFARAVIAFVQNRESK